MTLFNPTDHTIMVRDLDGTIRFWNKGAEEMYGWPSDETLGHTSHDLLHTRFPKPLESIEADLIRNGLWEGTLKHLRRDGTNIVVASRWELQKGPGDKEAFVLEINNQKITGIDGMATAGTSASKAAQSDSGTGAGAAAANRMVSSDEFCRFYGISPRDGDNQSQLRARFRRDGSSVRGTRPFSQTLAAILVVLSSAGSLWWFAKTASVREVLVATLAMYCMAWAIYSWSSREPRQEIAKRFGLMTGTLLAILTAFESVAFLGLLDYRLTFSTRSYIPFLTPARAHDRELLFVHPSHHRLHGDFVQGNLAAALCLPAHPQPYDLRYDHNGLRNETDLTRADIAVIGDSYVESPNVSNSVLMTTVLGNLHRKTIANLGMSGYGPQQELVVLKRYALPLQPETIVWLFFEGNDLSDMREYEEMSRIQASGGVRLAWHRSFTRNASLALTRLSRGCVPSPSLQKQFGLVKDSSGQSVRMYFGDVGLPLSPLDLKSLSTLESLLKEAYAAANERGIKFVVVFVPMAYRVYHDIADFSETPDEMKWWVVNDLPQRLEAIIQALSPDIGFIDLTSPMTAAAKQGTLVYMPDDTHWTHEGHKVVAETVSRVLSSDPTRSVQE